MEQEHLDYIEYYKSRMKKFEHNPMYKNSYEAEKKLYEAIAGIEKLEDFRGIIETQKLNLHAAIAQTKDKMAAEQKTYLEIKENIRAKAGEKVLQVIDHVSSETDLINTVNNIEAEVMKEVSRDEMTGNFYSDFVVLENILSYENAVVPDEWKKEINAEIPSEMRKEHKEFWLNHKLPEARKFFAGWDLNYDLIWEDRHRRRIPIPDDILKKRIVEHKNMRGI